MKRRGFMSKSTPKTGMAPESSAIEQAIARALRDNLERIQRSSEELHHAVNDVVAACGSNKPTNALPSPLEAHITDLVGRVAAEPAAAPQRSLPSQPVPMASKVQAEPEVEEPIETE